MVMGKWCSRELCLVRRVFCLRKKKKAALRKEENTQKSRWDGETINSSSSEKKICPVRLNKGCRGGGESRFLDIQSDRRSFILFLSVPMRGAIIASQP
jgi:hypothetical protein